VSWRVFWVMNASSLALLAALLLLSSMGSSRS